MEVSNNSKMEGKEAAKMTRVEQELEEGELEDSDGENMPLEDASAFPAKSSTPCNAVNHRPKAMPIPFHTTHRALDILTGHKLTPTRMTSTGNKVCSDVQTTAACRLPGYGLRCRKVPFKEHTPRKRKVRGYPSVFPKTKITKVTNAKSGCDREISGSQEKARGEDGQSVVKSDKCSKTINEMSTEDRSSDGDGLQIADEGGNISVERSPTSEVHKPASQAVSNTTLQSSEDTDPTLQLQGVGYGTTQSAQAQVPAAAASSSSKHVLLTDRATGQVEELTPLSSPGDSLPSMGEGSPLQPPSLCPTNPSSGPPPTLLQQSLCVELRCPLRLPEWLVIAMSRVQAMAVHTPQKAPEWCKKMKAPSTRGITRARKQNPLTYAGVNVERLVTGQFPLATVVDMFADTWNIPNSQAICQPLVKYLQTSYSPRIEHVVDTYYSLCTDVQSKRLPMSPSSPSFPSALLRPECQLVALLHHTAQLNPATSSLLPEVISSMSSAVLSPLVKFHRMAGMCRLLTAVCRLLGDQERVLLLCCDLLRRPLTSTELPVITGMVGVWPAVFARVEGADLVRGGRLQPAGVEAQPLSYSLEVIVTVMLRHGGLNHHYLRNLSTLCSWGSGQNISVKTVDKLATVLLHLLQTSCNVTVEQQPCQGWNRPKPSRLTFQLVHSLRLLAWFKEWVWTSDILIRAHIWPILQAWNSKRDSVPEATVMAVVRLLGFIGQNAAVTGTHSLTQLQKLLLSLLLKPQEIPLSIQLSAAESVIDLCPPSLPTSREAVAVLWQWLRGLANHPAGSHLFREFCPKLSTAPPKPRPARAGHKFCSTANVT